MEFVRQSTEMVNRFDLDPIDNLRQLYRILCEMASAAQLNYTTPAIESIVALVEQYGGGAKPSGAGGGDCVIALFPTEAAQNKFQQHCPFPHFIAQTCMGIQNRTQS